VRFDWDRARVFADAPEVSIFVIIHSTFDGSYENIISEESLKFRDSHEDVLKNNVTLFNSGVEINITSVTFNTLR